jgi:ATP-dependent Lon protease
MPLRHISIAEGRASTLRRWSVHEVKLAAFEAPTRHLVGYALEAGEGRVSSPIIELDSSTRRARTSSGRVYALDGEPGSHPDGEYVFERWQRIQEAQVLRDVTSETLAELDRARH